MNQENNNIAFAKRPNNILAQESGLIKRKVSPAMTTTAKQSSVLTPAIAKTNTSATPTTTNNKKATNGNARSTINMAAATSTSSGRRAISGPAVKGPTVAGQTPGTRFAGKVSASAQVRKAHVRFDDYLDLNEENMRRSCKRLMNHLYSDSNIAASVKPTGPALMNCGGQSMKTTPPPPPPPPKNESFHVHKPTGAPIKSITNNSTLGRVGNNIFAAGPHCNNNHQQASKEVQAPIVAVSDNFASSSNSIISATNAGPSAPANNQLASTTNGKSYLRSQYERRQLRQLELMNKMHLESGSSGSDNSAVGASGSRHQQEEEQQQDLVARSHELSKRRFFEKLERRESIKNLNLSTATGHSEDITCTTAAVDPSCNKTAATNASQPINNRKANHGTDNNQAAEKRQQHAESNKQKGLGDDELLLKLYQSIVLKGNTEANRCEGSSSATSSSNNCMSERLMATEQVGFGNELKPATSSSTAANTHGKDDELIGFYNESPQTAIGCSDEEEKQQLRLIETSSSQKQQTTALLSIQEACVRSEPNMLVGQNQLISQQLSAQRVTVGRAAATESSSVLSSSSLAVEAVAEIAKFEIQVPETSLNSSSCSLPNQCDGFISSGLLLVKDLEVAGKKSCGSIGGQAKKIINSSSELPVFSPNHLEPPAQVATLSPREGPPLLSGRHKDEQQLDAFASTQTVANKTKHPPHPLNKLAQKKQVENGVIDGQITEAIITMESQTGACIDEPDGVGGGACNVKLNGSLICELSSPSNNKEVSGDNHQKQAIAIGSTISGRNNHNNNNGSHNNNNDRISLVSSSSSSGSNKMNKGKILPSDDDKATTSNEDGSGKLEEKVEGEEEREGSDLETSRQQNSIEVCGASNEARNHEAPEMRMLVGQSGGAAATESSGRSKALSDDLSSGHPVETESTAQQQVVASLQTEITKLTIRDVLPEAANEFNRPPEQTVVSEQNGAIDGAAKISIDKVSLESVEQVNGPDLEHPEKYVNQVAHEDFKFETNGYANSSMSRVNNVRDGSVDIVFVAGLGGRNNVEHDEYDQNRTLNDNADDVQNDQLIKSFTVSRHDHDHRSHHHRSPLMQKNSIGSSSAEEDGGSSCSSSGFGASVSASVTGSTDGTNSINNSSGNHKRVALVDYDRGLNLLDIASSTHQSALLNKDDDPIYDSIRSQPRHYDTRHHQVEQLISNGAASNEFPNDYEQREQQLVGPDQAYPRSRPLLLENHNYASVTMGQCNLSLSQEQLDASIVLERDDLLEGYANLPIRNKKASPVVGYATVRPMTSNCKLDNLKGNNSTNSNYHNGPNDDQKRIKHDDELAEPSDASLSGQSYTTGCSTTNSGGFSALKPARVECSSANNFNSLSMIQQQHSSADTCPVKKSSLLKRFGSLVSRAFTAGGNGTQSASVEAATSSKINELPADRIVAADGDTKDKEGDGCGDDDGQQKKREQELDTNGIGPKSALVIEQQAIGCGNNSNSQRIGEADLVILPTKHVNQRKQPQQQQQNQVQKRGSSPQARRHDDRLSRGSGLLGVDATASAKKHSRKIKKTASTSSIASIGSDQSSTGDSAVEAGIVEQRRLHHSHRRHPKRSDSLFEDLESLVSEQSEQPASVVNEFYGRDGNLRQSARRRAQSSGRHHQRHHLHRPIPTGAKVTSQPIDIDCISPIRLSASNGVEPNGSERKSSGPRSLLRLFSSSSQRNSESTPNIATASSLTTFCKSPAGDCDFSECNQLDDEVNVAQQQQPSSGFWGFSSLMSHNHANVSANAAAKADRKSKTKAAKVKSGQKHKAENLNDPVSLVYSTLQPLAAGYRLHPSQQQEDELEDSLDKYQSLNLYQNLLRNYAKRRDRGRHGHHHHGHHHHHHHHHRTSHHHQHYTSGRIRSSARCGQECNKNCQLSSSSGSEVSSYDRCSVVWGQLIKINKTDGTQVIELQRPAGKSWGFFVARGAINNIKGIFISRMHDSVTSSSLTGLLSIGDRILAIDECPIEPDYDILRVNQMISKKSKILLKVKPFKG